MTCTCLVYFTFVAAVVGTYVRVSENQREGGDYR